MFLSHSLVFDGPDNSKALSLCILPLVPYFLRNRSPMHPLKVLGLVGAIGLTRAQDSTASAHCSTDPQFNWVSGVMITPMDVQAH
jgi:hypothetical protein